MSKDLNRWEGIGRLGSDIAIKYMPNGKAVVNIAIACGDDYKDNSTERKVERTNWIDLVFFERSAEILNTYCGKGSRLFVSGKLTKRKWEDKEGNARYSVEVVVTDFQMLDSKGDGRSGGSAAPAQNQAPAPDADFDDDIPFK